MLKFDNNYVIDSSTNDQLNTDYLQDSDAQNELIKN